MCTPLVPRWANKGPSFVFVFLLLTKSIFIISEDIVKMYLTPLSIFSRLTNNLFSFQDINVAILSEAAGVTEINTSNMW